MAGKQETLRNFDRKELYTPHHKQEAYLRQGDRGELKQGLEPGDAHRRKEGHKPHQHPTNEPMVRERIRTPEWLMEIFDGKHVKQGINTRSEEKNGSHGVDVRNDIEKPEENTEEDEISDKPDDKDNEQHVPIQNGFMARSWAPTHDIRLSWLDRERNRGEGVGHQIDPQNL